jgi:hypothetical protein
VGPRTDLDDVEKIKFFTLLRLELRPFRLPARSVFTTNADVVRAINVSSEQVANDVLKTPLTHRARTTDPSEILYRI